MQFTNLSVLYKITGYTDRRSVEKFLRSLNVRLHRVGKEHCVVTEEFAKALTIKYGQSQGRQPKMKKQAANLHEQAFLDDLQKFLSHV